MELLILALLGALTAGVGLWAARGERPAEDGKDDDGESRGGGPRSSPELPEANRDAGAAEAGKAVVLGGSRPGEELRAALQRAPEQIRPDVVPGASSNAGPSH